MTARSVPCVRTLRSGTRPQRVQVEHCTILSLSPSPSTAGQTNFAASTHRISDLVCSS
ncbi:hypothetical protein CMUS01_05847 [Colletotrichum musicola]|uniref:Uncharacterized protein n=1 Tax=Colletotrichum musicola TaxID=2175873 RepID=A0A8H6NJU2_9PEZI|nr:hypothetical protein CMUS01_05847 [Colletotrichum musicola]